MPQRLYRVLREQLKEAGFQTRDDIAELWDCHPMQVGRLLNGRAIFTQVVQYITMDALHWPYEKMYILFPKNGIEVLDKRINLVRAYCDEIGKTLVDKSTVEILKTAVKTI